MRKKYGSNDDGLQKSYERSHADEIISQTYCKCSFIIEPVVFLQNFASSIIGIAFAQFIYSRILNRIIQNGFVEPKELSNSTAISNFSFYSGLGSDNQVCSPGNGSFINGSSDFDEIRLKAQRETANFTFICSLFGGIPCIFTTNLLGVNCSKLGRKFLLIMSLSVMTLRCIVFLLLSIFPLWPDWLFYMCALVDGLSGSSGLYGLVLHCYIVDLTTANNRSYRLNFINYISAITSLIISYGAGFVIKYLGYVYIFATGLAFYFLSLVYLIAFVPEPLMDVRRKSLLERLRSCSLARIKNSFYVFLRKEHPVIVNADETETLLYANDTENELRECGKVRQRRVIIFEVVANLIYCGGAAGIGSIFTLYIMNKPFCFDSVAISTYTLYSTIVSIVCSLLVSRFIRVNDILISIASTISHLSALFMYVFTNNSIGIYLATTVGSIGGLEYGYVRAFVSKLVTKHEATDALTFIACVDTLTNVVAQIVFPFAYRVLVGSNIKLLFFIAIGIITITLTLHIIAYILYKKPLLGNTAPFVEENSSSIGAASIAAESIASEPVISSNNADSISQFYNSVVIASNKSNISA